MRTFLALAVTVMCTLLAARAHASTLDEWVLPPGINERDIDVSLGPPVALVQGSGVIDRFDPSTSTLTHWTVGPTALQFTVAGQIAILVARATIATPP